MPKTNRIMINLDEEYFKMFEAIKKHEHISTTAELGRIMIEKYITAYMSNNSGLTITTDSIDYDKL